MHVDAPGTGALQRAASNSEYEHVHEHVDVDAPGRGARQCALLAHENVYEDEDVYVYEPGHTLCAGNDDT